MPDLGFRDEFEASVLDGSKPLTLRRAWKNDRTPDLGAPLGFVVGWRSPRRRRFATGRVEFRATVIFTALGFVDLDGWRQLGTATPWADIVRAKLAAAVALAETNRVGEPDDEIARLDGFPGFAAFWQFHTAHRKLDLFGPRNSVLKRELIGFGCITPEIARP